MAFLAGPWTTACATPPAATPPAATDRSLVGRVLLPGGEGSRGVEVIVTLTGTDGATHRRWLLFDEEGRFSDAFQGHISRLTVSTGLQAELVRLEAEDLARFDRADQLDVGVIDLREKVFGHRLLLRQAPGAPGGDVRVALCFGPPPVGPQGEPVSLGSRQFPPVTLGSPVDWLLPLEAEDVYFLVERPEDAESVEPWRSGKQKLFGPFRWDDLPAELTVE